MHLEFICRCTVSLFVCLYRSTSFRYAIIYGIYRKWRNWSPGDCIFSTNLEEGTLFLGDWIDGGLQFLNLRYIAIVIKFSWATGHPVHLPVWSSEASTRHCRADGMGSIQSNLYCQLSENLYFFLLNFKMFLKQELDYERLYRSMTKPAFLFDGRVMLHHEKLMRIGFDVHSVGIKHCHKPVPPRPPNV